MFESVSTAAVVVLVLWFQFWTIDVNNGFADLGDHDYYRLLVRGWRNGHLHLDKAPSPELLALPDPYDPKLNGPHRLGDASYFKGKYYLYFGAAPAATLMFPFHLLTGREMTTGAAVFVFGGTAFVAASGLWLALRRRYFPRSAPWMAPLGLLALGLGTHLLALAQRPRFWELPIAAGIAFLMLALAAVYQVLHGRRRLLAMAMAGLCLGLATASRPTCLFAAPLLVAPLWFAWRHREAAGMPAWWRLALAAAAPLGACGAAMMLHNFARFENPLEFGQNYQLSGAYEGQLQHFSVRFLLHNIAVYFFQLPGWTWEFPFVFARTVPANIPGYFGTEEVSGLAVTFPFVWFALAMPLAWWHRTDEEARPFAAAIGAIAGCVLPVAGLLLCYFSTTMRYQADYATALALLALVGLLALERWAQLSVAMKSASRLPTPFSWTSLRMLLDRRLAVTGMAAGLCLVTAVMAVLVTFDYHGRSLRRDDPRLWQRFERGAHDVLAEFGRALGEWNGPRVLKVRFRPEPAGTEQTFWRAADARADERILVRHEGDHLIRFGYARGAAPVHWGRLLRWETNHSHTVSVQLPSLYGEPGRWMRGLRRRHEFRERSSASVWFSGGVALGLVVDPLPAGVVAGGAVGRDFSGQVRRSFERVYRDDEIGAPTWQAHAQRRGGTLRLRVRFPDRLAPEGEPLYAAGVLYGSDIIHVRNGTVGVKFIFEKWAATPVESQEVALLPGEQVIELDMPSFDPATHGLAATGDVIIRVNGAEVLRTRQTCHALPPGSESIGRNPFDTTCASEFRGWILDAQWVKPPAAAAASATAASVETASAAP